MGFFAEADGKLFVGKDDPDPFRCPDCTKSFPPKKADKGGKLRCPVCQHLGSLADFKGNFLLLTEARVLVSM